MPSRSLRRRFVVGTGLVALLLGAFFVGRWTAPDRHEEASLPQCTDARNGIAVPDSYGGPDGVAYFSRCELQRAHDTAFGEPAAAVKIYSQPVGGPVAAWWYPDCGLPEGVVTVGAKAPTKCGAPATTATAP